jgi:hypothetical protein
MNATIRKARATDRDELLRMRLRMQEHMEAANPGIWRITEEGRRQIWPEVEETLNDEEDRVLIAEEQRDLHPKDHRPHRHDLRRARQKEAEHRRRPR